MHRTRTALVSRWWTTAFFGVCVGWGLWAPPLGHAQSEPANEQAQPTDEEWTAPPADEEDGTDVAEGAEGAPAKAGADAAGGENDVHLDSRMPVGKPAIGVVVLSGAVGRPFDGAVDRHFLRYIAGSTKPVPMPLLHRAVAAAHGNNRTLRLPAKLLEIGERLDVPFVVVIEAVGRPRANHVFMGLVDVRAGKTLLAHREPIRHGTLDAASGHALADRLATTVARRWRRQHAAARQAPAEPPPAVDEPGEEAPQEPEEAPVEEHGKKHRRPRHDEAPIEPGAEAQQPMLLSKGRLGAGIELMQRVSHIRAAAVDGVSPPCYCGSKNSAQPFFPAVAIAGELTSGAFAGGRRRPQDSVGARLNLVLAPVRTKVIQGSTTSSVSSLVLQVDANVFYRWVWFAERALSPSLDLHVGVHSFAFPLKNTQYTSVSWLAPDLGLKLTAPIRSPIAFVLGLDLRPGLSAGKQAKAALGEARPGFGIAAEAGLAGGYKKFGLDLAFRYEWYQQAFKGTTNLPNMPTGSDGSVIQFANAKLTDQLIALFLRAHLAF